LFAVPTLPSHRLTLVLGKPGTGKTVFALQILVNGAQRGEAALYVSFARHSGALLASAAGFGWDLTQMEAQKLVLLLSRQQRIRPSARSWDLGRDLQELRTKAANLGAQRIIFDGLDRWLPAANDPMAALEGVYRIRDWLFENQFMGLITTTLGEEPNSLMQYAADCTIVLRESEPPKNALRHLHLAKRRGGRLLEEELPFIIGTAGIELLPRRAPEVGQGVTRTRPHREVFPAGAELIKGIQTLDRFLEVKQAELDFQLARQAVSCLYQ
jgi:circadian clock protein KaiC